MDPATALARLRREVPHLSAEIDALSAPRAAQTAFIEITRPSGAREIVSVDHYMRMNASELAVIRLRWLTPQEVRALFR